MARISNYRVNTHFTGLKQLPDAYNGSLSVAGGSYRYSLGVLLGSSQFSVPSGIYVETPLLKTSLDGNINRLAHEINYKLNDVASINIAVNQITNNLYEIKAVLNNPATTAVLVPSFTTSAIMRLAIAPFD